MGTAYPRPGARLIGLLDLAAVVWTISWIVLAIAVGREVRDLRQLSDTVIVAGVAVEETGDLVASLADVPFVGSRVGEVAERVREAGASARLSGRASRDSTEDLSVLLAVAIGLVPTLPLIGLYAPLRLSWARERRTIRRALALGVSDTFVEEFLARRAVQTLRYQELREVTADPWGDLASGRYGPLADRELLRLGLRRGREP
jgi:hypothetical protein